MNIRALLGGIEQDKSSKDKRYFVIRETDTGGLEESGCEYSFSEAVVNGNEIEFHCELLGTIVNNEKITGTQDGDVYTFEMIKISDSVEPIGTANYTIAGEESVTEDVYSFYQEDSEILVKSGHAAGNHKGVFLSFGFEDHVSLIVWDNSGVDVEGHDGLTMRAGDLEFYTGHDLDEGGTGSDTASYSMDAESTYSNTISFNGSNDSQDVSGTIQIQLPVQ